MTSRPRALGGFIPPTSPAPTVGYGVRILGLSPFTTEWFKASPLVNTVANKSGDVKLYSADIVDMGPTLAPYALLASPSFTGLPQAPTPPTSDVSGAIATTQFVHQVMTSSVSGVASFNTRTGAVTLSFADITGVFPAGTGTPAMDGAAAVGVANTWSRSDHVHPSDTSRLALAGGVMTGALTLSADPAAALGAATKQYVDGAVTGNYVDMGTY